jgi:hypothetical protein
VAHVSEAGNQGKKGVHDGFAKAKSR